MKKIRLAVIFGGNSSEYPVSLHSVASVLRSLNKDKYDIILLPIDQEGTWYYYDGDIETLEHDHWKQHESTKRAILSPSRDEGIYILDGDRFKQIKVDCILPILHGKNGEDGTLQGLLELSMIPYVGCNHISSAISMDKEYTHIICEAAGITMAPYICISSFNPIDYDDLKNTIHQKLQYPLFVKPANAGSSFGITKVVDSKDLQRAIQFAFEYDTKVIIESEIDGFEVGCAVLGNKDLIVGEVDEIDTHNTFFDYEAKYDLENTEIICPARITKEVSKEIKTLAKRIFIILGCSGLSRVDMFLTKDCKIYFNEINTIPGFTSASRYPTMMKEVGIEFPQLLDRLILLAME